MSEKGFAEPYAQGIDFPSLMSWQYADPKSLLFEQPYYRKFTVTCGCNPDIGEDTGTPVSEDYQVPFKFTGDLKKVAIQLTDVKLSPEDKEEIRRIRAEIGLSR